ncbi:MAG: ATP-binding protein [Gemmatimonadaceae bacterium]|nr:ATP-binding protein [Gemmatimonadaceae bacterium]
MDPAPRSPGTDGRVPGVVLVGLAVAITCAAAWTQSPRVGYLVGAAMATVCCAFLAVRGGRRYPSLWGVLAVHVSLACWVALAVRGQQELWRIGTDGERAVLAQAEADARRIAAAIDVARQRHLVAIDAAVRDTARLEAPRVPGAESAIARMDGARIVSSAGTWRIVPPTLAAGDTVSDRLIATPLYRVLVQSRRAGGAVIHAATLVQALPPVNQFARSVVGSVVGPDGMRRIVVGTERTLAGFTGGDAAFERSAPSVLVLARLPTLDGARLMVIERARVRTLPVLALAAVLWLATAWRRPSTVWRRLGALALVALVLGLVPLSALSNRSPLMDAAVFYVRGGGPWSSNLAALGVTATLIVIALLALARQRVVVPRAVSALGVLIAVGVGPFLIRSLARGITPPPDAVPGSLWIAWQLVLALAAFGVVFAAVVCARWVPPQLRRAPRGPPAWVASACALTLGALAPVVWRAPAGWPDWYTAPWIGAVALVALAARRPRVLVHAAIVSGAAAAVLVWGATARRAVELAERDVGRLDAVDEDAARLLERLGWSLLQQPLPVESGALLAAYGASDLAAAGFRASLRTWRADASAPLATVRTSLLDAPDSTLRELITSARADQVPLLVQVEVEEATLVTLVVADTLGGAVTISVAPRTLLARDAPQSLLVTDLALADARAPYTLSLTSVAVSAGAVLDRPAWMRQGSRVIGDWLTQVGRATAQVHAEVDLRSWDALLSRGVLLVALNVTVAVLLWCGVAAMDGGVARWMRWRSVRAIRSYRTRLTLVLALFFAIPAVLFAAWTATRARDDDRAARGVLAREALRALRADGGLPTDGVARFLYRERVLRAASDPVLLAAAPFGAVLDDATLAALIEQRRPDSELTQLFASNPGAATVVAYRALAPQATVVVMAPALRDDGTVATRRDDLLLFVLAACLIGVLAASALGGRVARQLERPVDALRTAVFTLPGASPVPGRVPAEFVPAFEAVERTARALTESRDALEAARRRTEAVLRNVASAVVAFEANGRVVLANPRADALFAPLPETLSDGAWPTELADRVAAELSGARDAARSDEPFAIEIDGRQWQGRCARLAAGGVVLTLDDVTDLARAERVIAWGEMARQVAHEIKNPLTPVRLGIQHLRRAWRDGRGDFGPLLETNVDRILTEIDHLDQIARQFSRFGAPPTAEDARDDGTPLESVDVVAVAHEVIRLEAMGDASVAWAVDAAPNLPAARSRRGELREVLLNLCENARLAEAREVTIRIACEGEQALALVVSDDGVGIPAADLPRIFEPRFSTRTSGTGLGLAICRRLVLSWGGRIEAASTPGVGTAVTVTVPAVRAPVGADRSM